MYSFDYNSSLFSTIILAETKETKASVRSRSVPSRQLLKGKLEISKPMPANQGQPHQSRSGKERSHGSGKGKYKEYEMSHRTELEHVLQRLVLMSYFPSGFWSRILTRILADDSVVEIVRYETFQCRYLVKIRKNTLAHIHFDCNN